MKGRINQFIFKKGVSPVTITEMTKTFLKNENCILVYDNNNCVGIIFEHYESRNARANGQAEIRFWDRFNNEYGKWHRIFINGQRISFNYLMNNLNNLHSIEYSGLIKG
ncbi:MAG: hypothetical protein HDQ88_00560 [Clostridia bacterium]|nr:hypothetical protein [Clostridia bacterium]